MRIIFEIRWFLFGWYYRRHTPPITQHEIDCEIQCFKNWLEWATPEELESMERSAAIYDERQKRLAEKANPA